MIRPSMYESFFGLRDLPFRLTPDPDYLFMSAKHREAFAHLLYGVNEGSGFVAITGEVGAGKTTLIRTLLRDADEKVVVIYIVNPVLTSTELLQTINAELGLPSTSTSRKELIEELNAFLEKTRAAGGRTVVIVDEAQNLDPVVLEQLRLLSNLETETEKLIQIVLAGQPELRTLLERHDLRQLNQRVTVRWHLETLDRGETAEYLKHRLSVAGANAEIFESRAVDLIHQYSEGTPRLINIIAHRALLVAYSRNRGKVGPTEIAEAAKELGHTISSGTQKSRSWTGPLAGVAAVAGAAGIAYFTIAPGTLERLGRDRDVVDRTPVLTATETPVPSAPSEPAVATAPEVQEAPTEVPAEPEVEPASAAEGEAVAVTAQEPPEFAAPVPTVLFEGLDGSAELESVGAALSNPSADPRALVAGAQAGSNASSREPDRRVTDREEVLSLVSQGASFETATRSVRRLLGLWGVAPLLSHEEADGTLDLESLAASRDLRYLAAQMNTAFIPLLDLPAIVELVVPGFSEVRYALVEGADATGEWWTIDGGVSVPRSFIEPWWNGRAHVFWRDGERLHADLGPGSGGPAVRKLQNLLREAGVYDGLGGGLYDESTEVAVRRFQESKRVAVDGIAGPITQILLYNALGRIERPALLSATDLVQRGGSS